MQLTRKKIHEQVYFYTLIFIAICLPLSIFATSVFQLVLLLNWMLEGRLREKWSRLVSNRALQVFLLIFALHLVGLLWSENMAYGLKVFKIKLPLLAFPLIIATSRPLDMPRVRSILLLFSMAVFVATLASVLRLVGWLPGGILDYLRRAGSQGYFHRNGRS